MLIFFVLFYRLHGGDNVQIKRYFVSFWNGVDLRYKLLKGPRIRISIAGIIISRVSTYIYIRNNQINCVDNPMLPILPYLLPTLL